MINWAGYGNDNGYCVDQGFEYHSGNNSEWFSIEQMQMMLQNEHVDGALKIEQSYEGKKTQVLA